MALAPCPECGREISDRAPACPHCGCPRAARDASRAIAPRTERIPVVASAPEERVIWVEQPSRWSLACGFCLGVLLAIGSLFCLVITPLALLFPAFFGVVLWGLWLQRGATYYRLTTQRLTILTGLWMKTAEEIELYRVKDTRVEASLFQRFCHAGTITVISSDATTPAIRLPWLRYAPLLREKLRTAVEARRSEKGVRIFELE
jgi:hypothetical protein